MAKYTITHTCGHKTVADICGKESLRAGQADRMAAKLCPTCYKAQQTATAKQAGESLGLPALTGTDKQVAWAESIRANVFADLDRVNDQIAKQAGHPLHDKAVAALADIKSQDQASWWIDNGQHKSLQGLVLAKIKV